MAASRLVVDDSLLAVAAWNVHKTKSAPASAVVVITFTGFMCFLSKARNQRQFDLNVSAARIAY
jgi:hypothetical protein